MTAESTITYCEHCGARVLDSQGQPINDGVPICNDCLALAEAEGEDPF